MIQLVSQKLTSARSAGGPAMVEIGAIGAGTAGGAGDGSIRWLPNVGERAFIGVTEAEPLRADGSPRAEFGVGVDDGGDDWSRVNRSIRF
jgi:hypothetical protein